MSGPSTNDKPPEGLRRPFAIRTAAASILRTTGPDSPRDGFQPRGGGSGWLGCTLATLFVLAVFAASRLALVGIASEREYDEGVYLLSARAVAGGEALFTQVFSSQPPAFLESLALVLRATGDSLAHAQLFSLAWALLAMSATAAVARRLAGPVAAPLAAAALAVSVTFTNLAHMVQAEVPSLALAMASMAMALDSRARNWNRIRLVVSGLLFGAALLFKFFAAPLALPIGLLLLVKSDDEDATRQWQDGSTQPWQADLRRGVPRAVVWSLSAAALLLLPLLFYDATALYTQTISFHVAKFAAYRATPNANLWRAWHVIAEDPVVSLAAAAGLVLLTFGNRLAAAWLGVWGGAMLVVIRKQTPLFWRHLLLVSPPLAILAACAFALPLLRAGRFLRAVVVVGAIVTMALPVAVHPDGVRGLVPTIPDPSWVPWPVPKSLTKESARALQQTAEWIAANTGAGELVGGDDPLAIYLAGRRAPGQLCDTSMARIVARSLTLDAATANSALARVIVLRKDGRLSQLEGYQTWLGRNYELQSPWDIDIGVSRNVWIRKPGTPSTD